jgi:hypothetical protein
MYNFIVSGPKNKESQDLSLEIKTGDHPVPDNVFYAFPWGGGGGQVGHYYVKYVNTHTDCIPFAYLTTQGQKLFRFTKTLTSMHMCMFQTNIRATW